ncbi:MAG: hypothetical protein Q9226_008247 [Calogaya cf. arnoldii]
MGRASRMSVEALKTELLHDTCSAAGDTVHPITATYSSSSHCDDGKGNPDFFTPSILINAQRTVRAETPQFRIPVQRTLNPLLHAALPVVVRSRPAVSYIDTNQNEGARMNVGTIETEPVTEQVERPDTSTCRAGTKDGKPDVRSAIKQSMDALRSVHGASDEMKLVGMGQLNKILKADTNSAKAIRNDKSAIIECWDAIPGRFLHRLLSVVDYKGTKVVDRDWIANQAVSSMHTFLQLLPESHRNDKKFTKRIDQLLVIIGLETYILSETKTLALEVLDALADTPNGSQALLTSQNWPVLLQSAVVNPITRSIDDKAYRHAFTHRNAKDLLSERPELHERISDWTTIMRLVPDATPLFEHVYNLLRWHVTQKEALDALEWLAPLTQRLLDSADMEYTDALRSQNVTVLLSATLVRRYPAYMPALLFESRPYVQSAPTSKPAGWKFLQHRLTDIRSSLIPTLEPPGDDHKSTLVRLAGCYELVRAFITFLAESSVDLSEQDYFPARETHGPGKVDNSKAKSSVPKSGNKKVFDELPFSPGLLLRIREEISNVCSLTLEYLHERFEAWFAHKTIRRVRPSSSATDRFEFVRKKHKKSDLPNMAEDPLVVQQLTVIASWLREDGSELLRTEVAGTILNMIIALYGMAEELRSPFLVLLDQCQWVEGALNDVRGSRGWKAMVSDLESIARDLDPDEYLIQDGLLLIDVLRPVAESAILKDGDISAWIDIAAIAIQLDAEGPAAHLDLKACTTMLAIDLLRETDPKSLIGPSIWLKNRLLAVPAGLLKARDRMEEDLIKFLDRYV